MDAERPMKVLFLTHRLPYAPDRGDRIRAYYMLRELSAFAEVSLFSLVHDDDEASRAAGMPFVRDVVTARVRPARSAARAAWSLATRRPLTHAFLDAPGATRQLADLLQDRQPDLVLAYCSGMARFACDAPLDRLPLVVDLVDVDSQKWLSLSRRTWSPRQWVFAREARALSAFERLIADRAKAVLVINAREAAALRAIAPGAPVHVVENGIDALVFAPPDAPTEAPAVIFCGVMDYEPNVEGATWFAEHVWPRVRAARPDARFIVVGSRPPKHVIALGRQDPSIQVMGHVNAVQPHLWRAAVSVAPLKVARGLQNKVLEALAAGLPTVITSEVQAGLPAGIDKGCMIADEPGAFANAVVDLLNRAGHERRAMAAASQVTAQEWPQQLASLRGILEGVKAGPVTRLGGPRPALTMSPPAAALPTVGDGNQC